MIACMTEDGVIGKKGVLPWLCSDDMARFRRLTMGDTVIMGRCTAEHLRNPLPGRDNYVVGKSAPAGFQLLSPGLSGGTSFHHKWLSYHEQLYTTWIIGGAQLYEDAMPYCDILHLTVLQEDYDGDTYFPLELRDQYFVQKERLPFADGAFTVWYRKGQA